MELFRHSEYKQTDWFQYLDHGMKDLVSQSITLAIPDESIRKNSFHDYSYIVFPIAKAYEGFLKKLLFDFDLIKEEVLMSRHFRIGRSLNPELPEKYKDESWLFDDLNWAFCQQNKPKLAFQIWDVWQETRNKLFHYYSSDHENFVSYTQAQIKIVQVCEIMDQTVTCLKDR